MASKAKLKNEVSVEEMLTSLYNLQLINSKIDEIRTLRGDLPHEVQDMEDEIVGLSARLERYGNEIEELQKMIVGKKVEIDEATIKIERYEEQQNNVRNNREYDNLMKEIEFQKLEVELCQKRIKEYTEQLEKRKIDKETIDKTYEERKGDLDAKRGELDTIIAETKQEEEKLRESAKKVEVNIEPRLISAFKKIRKSARNGLAVVPVERDACGGCFNKIPAQRQLDIRSRKKIIVCEYCGRILVDNDLASAQNDLTE